MTNSTPTANENSQSLLTYDINAWQLGNVSQKHTVSVVGGGASNNQVSITKCYDIVSEEELLSKCFCIYYTSRDPVKLPHSAEEKCSLRS